jgi:hypothetical protein
MMVYLTKSVRNSNGNIDVRSLLCALNWRENPVQNPRSSSGEERLDEKTFQLTTTNERQQLKISYGALIADLSS